VRERPPPPRKHHRSSPEGLTELLGRDPVNLAFPATRAFDAPFHQTPLSLRGLEEFVLRPGPSSWSFYDLCFRAIPEEICEAILERFDIVKFCFMGLVWQDRLFGTTGIFLPPGREVESRETVEPLIGVVLVADDEIKNPAIWALAEIGDPRAVDPLVGALRTSQSEWCRALTAAALLKLGDPAGIAEVEKEFEQAGEAFTGLAMEAFEGT
jgi:hypothetical protein